MTGDTAVKLKTLGDKRFNHLMNLNRALDLEAQRCSEKRAYYAGCALKGAVLEGWLICMCYIFIDDVRNYLADIPVKRHPKGQIWNWDLNNLIEIAKALQWLPARRGKHGPLKVADWAHLVRELRNLVHPGRHIRDYPRIRLRKAHFNIVIEVVDAVIDHLRAKIERDLLLRLKIKQRQGIR